MQFRGTSPQALVILLLFALLLEVTPELRAGEFSTGEKPTKFLAERGLSSKAPQAVKATAFIIDYEKKPPEGMYRYLRVRASEERNLTEAETKKFLEILENRRTYYPDLIKLCFPSYEVGVTLISPNFHTEITFCLLCDKVFMQGEAGSLGAEIDRGHNALLEFFRSVLPGNEVLKGVGLHEKEPKLTVEYAIGHAKDHIPGDPLLKRIEGMRAQGVTEDLLEELAAKASAARYQPRKKPKNKAK